MLEGWKRLRKRLRRKLRRTLVRLRGAWRGLSVPGRGPARNARNARNEELLDAIWEALNVARDNKALVVARQGTIININARASQLCGRSRDELIGMSVFAELFEKSLANIRADKNEDNFDDFRCDDCRCLEIDSFSSFDRIRESCSNPLSNFLVDGWARGDYANRWRH